MDFIFSYFILLQKETISFFRAILGELLKRIYIRHVWVTTEEGRCRRGPVKLGHRSFGGGGCGYGRQRLLHECDGRPPRKRRRRAAAISGDRCLLHNFVYMTAVWLHRIFDGVSDLNTRRPIAYRVARVFSCAYVSRAMRCDPC